MPNIKCTNLEVTETVKAAGFTGPLTGNVSGNATVGSLTIGTLAIQKADNYALSAAEKAKVFIGCEMTAGSKVLTLGLTAGQMVIVRNVGATNAFTVKSIAGDTGTSLAAGRSLLLIAGSSTANTNIVIALD